MANINLLPWRETRRQARRQQFLTGLCGAAFLAVLSVWLWDAVVSDQIAYQETRNRKLTTQIKLLDQEVAEIRDLQLKRNRLIDRMRVIQALQGNRSVIVRLLDQLVRTVPEGVFYTSLQTDAQVVSIEGIAESNNRVSSLMRRLEALLRRHQGLQSGLLPRTYSSLLSFQRWKPPARVRWSRSQR